MQYMLYDFLPFSDSKYNSLYLCVFFKFKINNCSFLLHSANIHIF